ncbi:elongation of very long chain fatty acids protein 7-like [Contarinia nasturtii]|uniref:elongation of very long chain fatty acids protein 7-like n=1 Tax=Contarinia nasturtii TaxID=265458 RepID=UPI0012D43BAC|nr:elongation of very long chain fatty acids protein 7-like [Contarinia nasturtii]
MLVLQYLFEQITKLLALRDTRLQHLPFTSVESLITVVTLYLFFVLKWGPNFMEKRKPYNLKQMLLFYNGFQVFCNFSLFTYVIYSINVLGYSINFYCEELDFSDSWIGVQSAIFSYYYYLIKLLDLFDTVFFVLRKRTRQISFLHVYHHVAVLTGAFIAITWAPGGHPWLFGLLNSFVHIIMYAYYLGTVYSDTLKTNIFIKRSITQMQIIQFVFAITHLSLPFFIQSCNYPRPLLVIAISQNAIMLLLFSDFYYKTYIKSKLPKVKSS